MLYKIWISILKKSKLNALTAVIMLITIFFGTVTVTADDFVNTIVSISPSNQTVSPEETFIIDVYCVQGQPIKSFEFKLLFDSSFLQVNSVTEGDIFDGYTTFFNSGTINNSIGSIIDVYGLIIGTGNVTNSGTFVSMSVTAKDVTGISDINLYGVGVTNETEYVSLNINNGTVQIDATSPEFVDNSLSVGHTGDTYTFNVSVTDDVDTADDLTVKIDWSHGSLGSNESITHVGGNYFEKAITLDLYSVSDMTYTIYAKDTCGNSNTTIPASVTITDNINPSLDVDNSYIAGTTGDTFNFNITASDNIDVAGVNVSWSHGFLDGNLALSFSGSHWIGNVVLDDSLNGLVYRVQVNDSSNNNIRGIQQSKTVTDNDNPQITGVSSTPSSQEIGGFVNISTTVSDNIEIDMIFLNITYPDNDFENISIDVNKTGITYYCNKTYSMIGSYSYFIWVNDTSGNSIASSIQNFVIGDTTPPEISNIVITTSNQLDTDSAFGWINITCDVIDNDAVAEVHLNFTNPDGSWSNVSMNSFESDIYYYNSSTVFSQYGNFSYSVWVNDTSNSTNISSSYDFSMPPNWDIDMNGKCKIVDLTLISNHYNESGVFGWIREDVDNNGEIQILDLVLVSNHYDETWWV